MKIDRQDSKGIDEQIREIGKDSQSILVKQQVTIKQAEYKQTAGKIFESLLKE